MTGCITPAIVQRIHTIVDRWECHTDGLSLPVPIERIAHNEGWRILWGRIYPVYGYAIVMGNNRVMRIDERIAPAWARFTIAHEMGHVIAGHKPGTRIDMSANGLESPSERQASAIGLSLLVPDFMRSWSPPDIARLCYVPLQIVQSLGSEIGVAVEIDRPVMRPHEVRRIKPEHTTRRLSPHWVTD